MAGVGLAIDPDASASEIERAVGRLLFEPGFRERAAAFVEPDAGEVAADAVEEHLVIGRRVAA